MHRIQQRKIQIATVHDVKRTHLKQQYVQHIDIAHLAVADVNEAGDAAAQVQQSMQLDCSLGRAKRCLIEKTQAQVNGARIQRINIARDVDIQAQGLVSIELVGTANQDGCEVSLLAPAGTSICIANKR
jgi:hypothetical protein